MNIIEAVFVFGVMNIVFEFVLLNMMRPRTRLRLLGDEAKCTALHILFLSLNLWIHWGTLIGTMSGIFAFICSIVTVNAARLVFGTVSGSTYTRGLVGYSLEEIR